MTYVCGCYYHLPSTNYYERKKQHFLPQVKTEAHAIIRSDISSTVLKQTYRNPTDQVIKECIYTFPLYDGVSVVSFTCHVSDKTLHGLVKEKGQAQQAYQEAKDRGESAALLEQAPKAADVFSTKLGNVPANEDVVMEIRYIGELKHDAETDGVRFMIPTTIAPRYGSYGQEVQGSSVIEKGGISITVDADMPAGTFIRGIQSPTHPIAVSMGNTSTSKAAPQMHQASASLSLGTAELDKEFVIIALWDEAGTPKALLEQHPVFPNQRALMATLVPKFSLPAAHPEIIFVVDRSGSMSGNIPTLISAMKVFLKSLPNGTKFNICSFGNKHTFLFKKSKAYTPDSLKEAIAHVEQFGANYGGTETYDAMKGAVKSSYGDVPCEIMLLTDGQIWNQDKLFKYLNEEVAKSKNGLRVFTLGIGNGISHALVEGIARAGRGFSQTCTLEEKIDKKVVRMLKGGLSPHLSDCTLDVTYEKGDDDFEIVDKVADSLNLMVVNEEATKEHQTPKAPISLFDKNADADNHGKAEKNGDRFAGVPRVSHPKILQTPHELPPLFPFTRTSVYLLLSPDTAHKTPKLVTLRASSPQGPLELTIPVSPLSEPGETIHQLAAKKSIQELEEGRGWLNEAKDSRGAKLSDRYQSQFQDMVEREAVRLGVQYQMGGKWCSFVAVEGNEEEFAKRKRKALTLTSPSARKAKKTDPQSPPQSPRDSAVLGSAEGDAIDFSDEELQMDQAEEAEELSDEDMGFGIVEPASYNKRKAALRKFALETINLDNDAYYMPCPPQTDCFLGMSTQPASGGLKKFAARTMGSPASMAYFSGPAPTAAYASGKSALSSAPTRGGGGRGRGGDTRMASVSPASRSSWAAEAESDEDMGFGDLGIERCAAPAQQDVCKTGGISKRVRLEASERGVKTSAPAPKTPREVVLRVIDLQTYFGDWSRNDRAELLRYMGIETEVVEKLKKELGGGNGDRVLTALVVVWLERKMGMEKDLWELVVEKAREWVGGEGAERIWEKAEEVVGGI